MAFNAKGLSGEVQVGGRTAVRLGRWELRSMGGLAFVVEAALTQADDYLIQIPSSRTLRLVVGKYEWIWRNVTCSVMGDQVSITGSGKMTVVVRD